VQDSTTKDIIKQMKIALTDKSLPIQRAASEVCPTASKPDKSFTRPMTQVITAMYSHPDPVMLTLAELDSIISQSIKSLDVADQVTRHSHAQLVGYILASTQIERVVPTQEALPKLSKKDLNQDVMDDDVEENNVTAEVVKPMLTPQEMLVHLSTHFNKPNVSRRTRIGIFDFYAALFTKLGAGFCETNFSLIVSHLLSEVISSPRFINHNPNVAASVMRYERLLVRSLVSILLRDLVGVRMLSEQGQIAAIQELSNAYLKRWPAMLPGQVAPSSSVLVCALREVAGLLQQLGNAPPPVQVISNLFGCTQKINRSLSFSYRVHCQNHWLHFYPTPVILFVWPPLWLFKASASLHPCVFLKRS